MIKVGIIGHADEITGQLTGLLIHHPDADVKAVICPEMEGKRIDSVFKALSGDTDGVFCSRVDEPLDVIFLCDNVMSNLIPSCDESGKKLYVVALHPLEGDRPEGWVYGLPELNRRIIVHDTYCVDCPSAHATGVLLGLLPLAKNLLLSGDIRVTLSGSQAGEAAPTLSAEISDALRSLQTSFNSPLQIHYDSHDRHPDLLVSIETECKVSLEVLRDIYADFYDDHNFTFLTQDVTKGDVTGTNKCLISLEKDGELLKISTVTDSRIKGLIGAAVHNMNLLFGLHERVGLMLMPHYI